MRDRQEPTRDRATPDERHVLIDGVEILEPDQTPESVTPQEFIALLVAHFEESLIRKEHEVLALRHSLEEVEHSAAEAQYALRQELETANQVSRILERENRRLTAEIDALRIQIESLQRQSDTTKLIQESGHGNRCLTSEVEAPHASPDDTLLETLLTHNPGVPTAGQDDAANRSRRFRRRERAP